MSSLFALDGAAYVLVLDGSYFAGWTRSHSVRSTRKLSAALLFDSRDYDADLVRLRQRGYKPHVGVVALEAF